MPKEEQAPTLPTVMAREPAALTEVSVYDEGKFLPEKATVDYWLDVANHFIQSGITPEALDTPPKVLAVWLYARELQIPAMRALGKLYVVDGHVGMYGELMVQLVRRHGVYFKVLEHTDEICRIRGYRPIPNTNEYEEHEAEFTYKEAVGAGLAKKLNWQRYRRDMLQWRATARLLRFLAPDLIHGGYLPDEIPSLTPAMSDFPPGSPEFLSHASGDTQGGRRRLQRAESPPVAASGRRGTGTSRIGPSGGTAEPERSQGPRGRAAERAAAGGESDSERDVPDGDGRGTPSEAHRAPQAATEDEAARPSTDEGFLPPAAAFGADTGGTRLSPKESNMLEGWKAFLRGRPRDQLPEGAGPRIAEWWHAGYDRALEVISQAVDTRGKITEADEEGHGEVAEIKRGAVAAMDDGLGDDACPHESGTMGRFYWMSGHRGAFRVPVEKVEVDAGGDESGSEKESKDEAADRETWEMEAHQLMNNLGIGPDDGNQLLENLYGVPFLNDVTDEQLCDLVQNLQATAKGEMGRDWMTP